MEQQIKQLRVKLDGIVQLVKQLEKSRETSLTVTSLELSKMWLGKVLKKLGTENPYPESKNPNSDKIEPTADVAHNQLEEILSTGEGNSYRELSYIQKVKFLRVEIEKIEEELIRLSESGHLINKAVSSIHNSNTHCIEAGMWLGMELGRIRDTQEDKK